MLDSIKYEKERLEKQGGVKSLMDNLAQLKHDEADVQEELNAAYHANQSREQMRQVRSLENELSDIQTAIDNKQRQLEEAGNKYIFLTQPVVLEINRETTKQQEKVNNAFDKFIAEFDKLKSDRMKLASQAEKEYSSEIAPLINNRNSRITMDIQLDFVRSHYGYSEDTKQHNGF